MKRPALAIDGPAGSGKSTVARLLAKRLGYTYIDTGAMYRAAALAAKQAGIAPDDESALASLMRRINIEFGAELGDSRTILLDGIDVSSAIRAEEAGMAASNYSKSPAVRSSLKEFQRKMADAGGVVMEGRDIGTVVLPNADLKFFMDADPAERAKRRAEELRMKGMNVKDADILEDVLKRDKQDKERELAPLKPAPDSMIIDTTRLSIEEVIDKILTRVKRFNPHGGNVINAEERGFMEDTNNPKDNDMVTQPNTPEAEKDAGMEASTLNTGETPPLVGAPEAPSKAEAEAADEADESDAKTAESTAMRENFERLVEESMRQPDEGEIIRGTVVRVGKEFVMVDIGYKSEGQIPISEFTKSDGTVAVNAGDKIDVLIERREDENGIILLSKEKADKVRIWDELEKHYHAHTSVDGVISGKVKGGMNVNIGVKAFLPGSQLDLRPTRNHDNFVGSTGKFEILKFNRRRGNVVVSRRSILEKDRDEKRTKTLKMVEKGRIMTGVVKNLVEYGSFIDLGGIDGLLHITDMSWGRIKHPSDMLKAGQEIKVVVLKYDIENERVSLGLKQITPDPWDNVVEKYPIGAKVNGIVVSITDYGAFVEIEPGVEGLIHVSEMSWTKRVRHPSKIVKPNSETEVMILEVNPKDRRISLGLKQVEPNPWDVVAEKYPVGTRVKGKIRNITDFGIFVGVDEGIDGLVHISDISWTKRIRHPNELYKKGQEIESVVLNIDRENERFSLGVKQLAGDPWEDIRNRMRPGQMVTGKVVNATDFGVFLEIEEGVEGLIHVSELGLEKGKNPSEVFKAGDPLTVELLNIDPNERKIRLSLKSVVEKAEQEEARQYKTGSRDGTVKIADLLEQQYANKLKAETEAALKSAADNSAPVDAPESEPTAEPAAEPAAEPTESGN